VPAMEAAYFHVALHVALRNALVSNRYDFGRRKAQESALCLPVRFVDGDFAFSIEYNGFSRVNAGFVPVSG
jgi:hypothetical protein